MSPAQHGVQQPQPLTDRQREIKRLLDRGLTVAEIANEMAVTRNAIFQQVQRMRKNGHLPPDYTQSGQPPRELGGGTEVLAKMVHELADGTDASESAAAGVLALVQELRRTRDGLDDIARRITAILPR